MPMFERHILLVVMLNIVILSVIMANVIMLSVMAPFLLTQMKTDCFSNEQQKCLDKKENPEKLGLSIWSPPLSLSSQVSLSQGTLNEGEGSIQLTSSEG
jgi:hypothetical protein